MKLDADDFRIVVPRKMHWIECVVALGLCVCIFVLTLQSDTHGPYFLITIPVYLFLLYQYVFSPGFGNMEVILSDHSLKTVRWLWKLKIEVKTYNLDEITNPRLELNVVEPYYVTWPYGHGYGYTAPAVLRFDYRDKEIDIGLFHTMKPQQVEMIIEEIKERTTD